MGGNQRDGRGGESRDACSLAKRFRPDSGKPLDGLGLSSQVPLVSIAGFETREVKEWILDVQRQLTIANEIPNINTWLPERAIRGQSSHPHADSRRLESGLISLEARPPRLEPRPSLVVDEADCAASFCQPEV